MDAVNRYTKQYPEDLTYIIGGTAAMLHIRASHYKEVVTYGLDIHINSSSDAGVIATRWLQLLPHYQLTKPVTGPCQVIRLHSNSGQPITVFVNYRHTLPVDKVLGYPVEPRDVTATICRYRYKINAEDLKINYPISRDKILEQQKRLKRSIAYL